MTDITSNPTDHLALDIVLPWHENEQQMDAFKRLLKRFVIPFMAFMLVMPLLPDLAPQEEIEKKVITKLVLDRPEPEPIVPEVAQPEPEKPKPVKSKAKPKEKKAGDSSAKPNLQALSQQLTALRSSANSAKKQKKNVLVAKSGKVQKSTRSLLGQKNAISTSAGLKSSDLTVNTQGAQLADHQSGDIDSPIMPIELPTEEQYFDPKLDSKRDSQSIRRTLERHKGAMYALYTKALRKDPELNGRFIFEFTILPNGEVSGLKVKISELNNAALEKKMLDKIRLIGFGAKDVVATAVQYTYVFVPS